MDYTLRIVITVDGRARLLPSLRRPQVGVRRRPDTMPPAVAELELVLGS
ncbi:MAG: hypothetical protein JWN70_6679, partial [Planctomycetaceae bacterium]|nr:hypothetical protein [Planctomycetaceae bacterium]